MQSGKLRSKEKGWYARSKVCMEQQLAVVPVEEVET